MHPFGAIAPKWDACAVVGPGAGPDCLLIVYRCTRSAPSLPSGTPAPWSGLGLLDMCRRTFNPPTLSTPPHCNVFEHHPVPCAAVGNSGALLFSKYGTQIDAADVVLRINQVPTKVGRCRLTVSKPVLKAPMVSAL